MIEILWISLNYLWNSLNIFELSLNYLWIIFEYLWHSLTIQGINMHQPPSSIIYGHLKNGRPWYQHPGKDLKNGRPWYQHPTRMQHKKPHHHLLPLALAKAKDRWRLHHRRQIPDLEPGSRHRVNWPMTCKTYQSNPNNIQIYSKKSKMLSIVEPHSMTIIEANQETTGDTRSTQTASRDSRSIY